MKYFIILSLATFATSARLEKVYLPPHSGTSSGANAGIQTPYQQHGISSSTAHSSYSSNSQDAKAKILNFENEITQDGFHYAFETSNGIKAEEQGRVIPGAKPEEGSLQVSGSYSYIGDDGQTYEVTYTADENGFQPSGAHLPTPPPIPEAILRSLQLTAGNGVNYNSHKSSYDADNGY